MDDWREKLHRELLGPEARSEAVSFAPSTAAQLEIALGVARSEIAYVLSLAQAHRIPAVGAVNGDDVWLRLGDATVRFVYDRRAGAIEATLPGDEARPLSVPGEDVRATVREGIDRAVAAYKKTSPEGA